MAARPRRERGGRHAGAILIAAHALLALIPLAQSWTPLGILWLPLHWAIAGVSFGQFMLLAVLVGFGPSRWPTKMGAALLALAYLAIWLMAGQRALGLPGAEGGVLLEYAMLLGMTAVLLIPMCVVTALTSWKLGKVRFDAPATPVTAASSFQFSMLAVLCTTTLLAVLFGLARLSTTEAGQGSQVV